MPNPELNLNQISLWNIKKILPVKQGWGMVETHTHTHILWSDSVTTLSRHPWVYNPHALVAVHPLVLHVHPADKLRSDAAKVNFRRIRLKAFSHQPAVRFLYLQDLSEERAGSRHAWTGFEIQSGAAGFFQRQVELLRDTRMISASGSQLLESQHSHFFPYDECGTQTYSTACNSIRIMQ